MKRAITEYMQGEPDDNLVFQVIESGGGASTEDICHHLKTLWLKGYKPGTAKGPYSFGWFVKVTRQHFADLRGQEEARLNPTSATHWSHLDARMDHAALRMTDAIELPEDEWEGDTES